MNSMYCAEQINIPPELGPILKQFTKAVIKDRPEEADLYKFSANFFASLAGVVPPFDSRGQLVSGEGQRAPATAGEGQMIGDVIPDAGGFEAVQGGFDETEATIAGLFRQYDSNGNGRVDRRELPALVSDLREALGWADGEREDFAPEAVAAMLDEDADGTISLDAFRQLFFSDN